MARFKLAWKCIIIAAFSLLLTTGFVPASAQEVAAVPYISPFSDAVINNLRVIYSVGQAYGNRGGVFSKVGDSITVNLNFMHPFGWGIYDLAIYSYLQPAIDHFNWTITDADGGTSFTHESFAAGVGWATWGVLEPELADLEAGCITGEKPLECEYRIMRPAFALIMLGTNDVSYRAPADVRYDLERILRLSLEWGVIPIFSTIPMRPEWSANVYAVNAEVADMTADWNLPLWDYAGAMSSLPEYGLAQDEVHPSSPPNHRPQEAAIFTPDYLQYGYVMRNLTGLQMLDAVWRAVDANA